MKKKTATAIGYTPGDPAPVMFASGRGKQAEKIIEIANDAGVTIVEDAALAALLDTWADGPVNPGDFIPPWCWEAAAKVLAFVMQSDGKIK